MSPHYSKIIYYLLYVGKTGANCHTVDIPVIKKVFPFEKRVELICIKCALVL